MRRLRDNVRVVTIMRRVHGCVRRIALIAVLATMAGAIAPQATAQDDLSADPTGPTEPEAAPSEPPRVIIPQILIIRQSALFTDSIAARSIVSQAAAAEAALEAELDVVGESLRTRERELSDLKTTLPKAEFDALAAQFERDVRAFYARSQRERGLIDQAVLEARARLRKGAEGVLIDIMKRHGALVMLDDDQIVLSVGALDITREAIENLNQKVPSIQLEFPEPEAPPQP